MLSNLSVRDPFSKQLAEIIDNSCVRKVFQELTGPVGFRFCGHSDIGADRVVFWHKDKLNGSFKKYQKLSPWDVSQDGSQHQIYKLLIYLEDHTLDDNALQVIPASHLDQHVQLAGKRFLQLRPGLGDAIVIDQRITHTGQAHDVQSAVRDACRCNYKHMLRTHAHAWLRLNVTLQHDT